MFVSLIRTYVRGYLKVGMGEVLQVNKNHLVKCNADFGVHRKMKNAVANMKQHIFIINLMLFTCTINISLSARSTEVTLHYNQYHGIFVKTHFAAGAVKLYAILGVYDILHQIYVTVENEVNSVIILSILYNMLFNHEYSYFTQDVYSITSTLFKLKDCQSTFQWYNIFMGDIRQHVSVHCSRVNANYEYCFGVWSVVSNPWPTNPIGTVRHPRRWSELTIPPFDRYHTLVTSSKEIFTSGLLIYLQILCISITTYDHNYVPYRLKI